MNGHLPCNDAAEYVSALCDGEIIPAAAAQHIGACEVCQARLRDYSAIGLELRRVASIETASQAPANAAPFRASPRSPSRSATLWHKGWETMRIPRIAFAVLIAGVILLASRLAVNSVRADETGSVILLSTVGPDGPLMDCPLSTQDPSQATCSWYGKMGSHLVGYKVNFLSREGNRVELQIRTRIYPLAPGAHNFTPFELDSDPGRKVSLEPHEPLKLNVPEVGTLTLSGQWMDHIPLMFGIQKLEQLDPGPNEVRFASPLILKDRLVAGDLSGSVGGIFSSDDPDFAVAIYLPGQGRFLISLLPIKGAVPARVSMGRIAFDEGGHQWEIVNSVPVSRGAKLWVLHQPDFKRSVAPQDKDAAAFGNQKLVEVANGVWEPAPNLN